MTTHKDTAGIIERLEGHTRLWAWFGLSYAGWLTLPRVLMCAMPDDWQDRMATLLDEYQAAFPNQSHLPGTVVRAITRDGKLTTMPKWLNDYRHPDHDQIAALRARAHKGSDAAGASSKPNRT